MRLLNPGSSLATTRRVLQQLRHDPRTVALLLAVPSVLLVLLHAVLAHHPVTFQLVGPPLVGLFTLISMFLVTSIAMLRERTTGTLERLLTMPVSKLDLLVGYGLAFALVAVVQVAVVGGVGFGLFGLVAHHGLALVISLAVANALVGTSMGLFLSAFARTEFQAVQFLPAFVFPQILLCGLVVPRDQMARWLQMLSRVLPLTYAYDALLKAARPAPLDRGETADVVVLVALILASLTLGAVTLRRRSS